VSIELTRRCPLDELVAAGTLWILYSGGEIFARKDFLDIYTEAKKRGFLITLFTNGILINERIADHLAKYRPFAIEITLYGATRETYEKLTQKPGSYDRCMRGIQLLLERNLPLKLKTVPTTINQHEVYEMKHLAESLGVPFKFDPLVNPRIDCSQSPLAVRLSPEQVVALEFRDLERKEEYRRLAKRDMEAARKVSTEKQRYTCGGGMNACAVDPTGTMTICVISHQQGYDIRKGSFQEGWDGPLQEIRTQPRTRATICDGCQIKTFCSMCPANGELENGDPESPVDFLCQVAHLRANVLGYAVPRHDTQHSECPNCEGGRNHAALLDAAARIDLQKSEIDLLPERKSAPPVLNVLQSTSGGVSEGCNACSAVHA
jgi:radical SAM protein with 4Fe4S-binding SPASM domain